jgi:hypothetical protein
MILRHGVGRPPWTRARLTGHLPNELARTPVASMYQALPAERGAWPGRGRPVAVRQEASPRAGRRPVDGSALIEQRVAEPVSRPASAGWSFDTSMVIVVASPQDPNRDDPRGGHPHTGRGLTAGFAPGRADRAALPAQGPRRQPCSVQALRIAANGWVDSEDTASGAGALGHRREHPPPSNHPAELGT